MKFIERNAALVATVIGCLGMIAFALINHL